jgi:hypothetical protein
MDKLIEVMSQSPFCSQTESPVVLSIETNLGKHAFQSSICEEVTSLPFVLQFHQPFLGSRLHSGRGDGGFRFKSTLVIWSILGQLTTLFGNKVLLQ